MPTLTEQERHLLLVSWNDTTVEYSQKDKCIHQLFEAQVERTPDAVAIVFEEEKLTYRQLNQKANQLARHLQKLGVGAEVLVGICIERSLLMVVGLLAILKAGGAYVPLDPAYPRERLTYIGSDARFEVLLTQEKLVHSLQEHNLPIVCLDTHWPEIALQRENNLASACSPNHLAYVLYTSGSTGQPKGVEIEHRSPVALLAWAGEVFTGEQLAGVLASTSICFDLSVFEIFVPLSRGGKIILAKNALHLLSLSAAEEVTLINTVPSAMRELVRVRGIPKTVRIVNLAGEPLKQNLVEQIYAQDNIEAVFNLYGPSEDTTYSTFAKIEKGNKAKPVIGRPIANTKAYILDDNRQLVPIEEAGELYLGGAGLARGYKNRPELTREKFITNPFGEGRLYKTGDLVRYQKEGNIEYLDRLDRQVKIRGFRIELGEIEAVCDRHPEVGETVVMAREDGAEGKQLVAYVVPQDETQIAEKQTEQLSQWQEVIDATYSQLALSTEPTLNLAGWNDSYTGQPIPESEMRHWVEQTVARILTHKPKRILEIGCGTGMLLFRLAPLCDRYYGLDISQEALRYIWHHVQARNWQDKVTLAQKTADRFEEIEPESIDTVIINSVLQFFPSVDYLVAVLERAASKITPGGFIFVGDIRSYPWLEAFHSEIQLYKAPELLSAQQLQQRVQKSLHAEEDLTIAPEFFVALKDRVPQISHVEIQLKRGRDRNELSRFRYDAILHIGKTAAPSAEIRWLDWQEEQLTWPGIRQLLQNQHPKLLGLRKVPNPRLEGTFELVKRLKEEKQTPAKELRQALETFESRGIEPEDWWKLADEFGYTVYLNHSGAEAEDCYDAVLQQGKNNASPPDCFPSLAEPLPWAAYGNNPLKSQTAVKLEPKLRGYLRENLPDYMVPAAFVVLETMPLTPNGKIDRRALPAPDIRRRELGTVLVVPSSEEERTIATVWKDVLQLEEVGIHDNFFDLGGNSLLLTQVYRQLTERFGFELSIVTLFQCPTIKTLAARLNGAANPEQVRVQTQTIGVKQQKATNRLSGDIAIVGLSGRFPGANNLEEFWQNLRDGVESISFFNDEELEVSNDALSSHPHYVKAGAILPDIDRFDASFFGYSSKEAETIDPQQRILLECVWEAFESAGYNPEIYAGSVGVYVGSGFNTYLLNNVHPNRGFSGHRTLLESLVDMQVRLGNAKFSLPTRIAYKLNLKGPSLNVQTACSTSLVAVHLACKSLLTGECDLAIAGGVAVTVPQKVGYLYEEGAIGSPDGRCRTFDAEARGTLFGNGVGAVVLKGLEQAVADGDTIHGVIKGSAVNNDGALRVGYSAPSVEGQTAVITEAMARAGVEADTITYVEAHGTATALGDPIEITALTQAFRQTSPKTGYCAIGSVKTNIGHLAEAAGIAGLLKAVLALKHQQIPQSLHFQEPNPNIDFASSPFYVNTRLSEWVANGTPRRAGVSSFGMGGTNCHLILEEAPKPENQDPLIEQKERPLHLLSLSAKTEKALLELVERYGSYLEAATEAELADICFTANTGRKHFQHRVAVVAASKAELREQLAEVDAARMRTANSPQPAGAIAFLFTGQGSQSVNMGRQLYETQPTFRRTIEHCDEILRSYRETPLLELLYPPENAEIKSDFLTETAYTQPALFALEYALFELWQSWGIRPDAVMGHSVGEYVAACVAGVFSLEDGLKLIAERSRLMQALPAGGAMVAAFASEEQVRAALDSQTGTVALAAINGPESMVISGQGEEVRAVTATLEAQGIKTKQLAVSHAFHSPLMEPMLAEFEKAVRSIQLSPPQMTLISNVTGEVITDEVTQPNYWCRHILQPVQFAASVESLKRQGVETFVEIGPKPILLGMARYCLPENEGVWLPSLRPPQADWQQLLSSVSELYLQGFPVDWLGFDKDYTRRRLPLPTYPFQRERYWIEAGATDRRTIAVPRGSQKQHPLLGQSLSLAATQELRFQAQISPHSPPWLKDHRIFETILLPGTGYLEIALAAGAIALSSETLTLKNVVLERALTVPEEESKTVQVVLKPQGIEGYGWEIYSLALEEENSPPSWTLHASGQLFKSTHRASQQLDLATLEAQCTEEIPHDILYQRFHKQGMNYGASFKAIAQLRHSEGLALGKIELGATLAAELGDYHLHPVVLDACMQVLEALVAPEETSGNTYVPIGLDCLQVYARPEGQTWGYATLQPVEHENPKDVRADFRLLDGQGKLIALLEGLQLKQISRQQIVKEPTESWQDWLYEVQWQLQEKLASPALSPEKSKTQHWLILADEGGIGRQLAALLEERGHCCTLVFQNRGERGQTYEQVAEREFRLNSAHPEDLQQLVESLPTLESAIQLWSLDAPEAITGADLELATKIGCGSTLHLVQALVEKSPTLPSLWLVTRGTHAIDAEDIPGIARASLWGMGKAIALEYPDLNCSLVDLDPRSSDREDVQKLLAEIQANSKEETQVAFRQGKRYVPRLARHNPQPEWMRSESFRLEISERGTLEQLHLSPAIRPQPGQGEIEIEVYATGLNFRDVLNTLGLYPGNPPLGSECAGKVVAIGEGVQDFAIGEPVVAIATNSFARHVTTKAELAIAKPAQLSFAEAATIPAAFLTAYWCLHHQGQIAPGDRVLIHAAAGGVGQAAVQLAQQAGAEVFGTASPPKWQVLESLGVDRIMNSRSLDFAEQIMAATSGRGVDIAINSLTGEGFVEKSLGAMAPNGRFLELAKRNIWQPERVAEFRPDLSYHIVDLAREFANQPALIQSMLRHLMQQFEEGSLKPLPATTFPIQDAVEAFRYMQQAKHVGKIVVTQPTQMSSLSAGLGKSPQQTSGSPRADQQKLPDLENLHFRSDRSYLIAGGWGELGLQLARWLVERGARQLVLVGRSEPQLSVKQEIQALETLGANMTVVRADLSDVGQMAEVLDDLEKNAPPLAGIFHTAAVLDDGVIKQLSWERFERVMAPKVQGAWNLHTLTRGQSLDYFVLFSSIASLFGSAGQANYCAANRFLDSLAAYRRSQGLPATSINWGPWSEIGMAVRKPLVLERLNQMGLGSINPQQGLQALEQICLEQPVQVAVVPIDWSRFREQPGVGSPFFQDLAALSRASNKQQIASVRQQLEATPPQERRTLLLSSVRAQVAKTLGLKDPQQIDPQQRLIDLGLDSLMAIELKNYLQSTLACSLGSTLLFDHPTLEALVDYLASDVLLFEPEESSQPNSFSPEKMGSDSFCSTLVSIQPQGSQPPLFFVPGIIGNVFYLEALARYLGSEQPFYGLRSLGLDEEVQPYTHIEEIAAHHLKAIQTVQPQGPYLLGGHSFGGKVAFEMARQLCDRGQEVSLLAILDIPPGTTNKTKEIQHWDDAKYIAYLADEWGRSLDRDLGISAHRLQSLEPEQQIDYLLERLQAIGQMYGKSDLVRLVRVYKANTQATVEYTPRSRYAMPITLLLARETSPMYEFLPDPQERQKDPTWGWSKFSTQSLNFEQVPGNHFTMTLEPQVRVLAEKLRQMTSGVNSGKRQKR